MRTHFNSLVLVIHQNTRNFIENMSQSCIWILLYRAFISQNVRKMSTLRHLFEQVSNTAVILRCTDSSAWGVEHYFPLNTKGEFPHSTKIEISATWLVVSWRKFILQSQTEYKHTTIWWSVDYLYFKQKYMQATDPHFFQSPTILDNSAHLQKRYTSLRLQALNKKILSHQRLYKVALKWTSQFL